MLKNFNPFVRYASNVRVNEGYREFALAHDSRLFLCREGEARLIIGDVTQKIHTGTLVYLPAYTPYKIIPSSPLLLGVLNFDLTEINSHVSRWQHININNWDGIKHEEKDIPDQLRQAIILTDVYGAKQELDRLIMILFNREAYFRENASVILKGLLLKIMSDSPANMDGNVAFSILSYVKKNYREKLNCKEIAKLFNYHPNHINRIVKRATGRPLSAYIIFYRLTVAKELLISTDKSITSVCSMSGFSSPSYFSEQFIRQEGMTPREYRARIRSTII